MSDVASLLGHGEQNLTYLSQPNHQNDDAAKCDNKM
jgi:hypothetical protein